MLDERILIASMYIITYPVSMWIQLRDPEVKVTWEDWILSFFSNIIGAITIYFIMIEVTENRGFRIGTTVFGSLFTYRVMQILLSDESQRELAKGISFFLASALRRIFNPKRKEDGND